MTKQEITIELKERHQAFLDYMNALSEENFMFSLNNKKWIASQEMEHIIKSTAPLVMLFKLPKEALKAQFGVANRPSRTFDNLVARYREKLANAASMSIPADFVPKVVSFSEREVLSQKLWKNVEALCELLQQFHESDLDIYILPHPLLGKLTLREMFQFTVYHVEHHHHNSMRNLSGRI